MSLFNSLRVKASCPSCGAEMSQNIQFQYGDTYQHEYKIGDEILWSNSEPSNDWGCSSDEYVVIEGLGENCGNCAGLFPVFDVFVKENILEKATSHSEEFDFSKDNIVVLKK